MAWFKMDDGFANSKPVLRIPRRYRLQAVGLWALAGTWSAKEETDGFIPEYVLEELCGTAGVANQLVQAGLWETVSGSSDDPVGIVSTSSEDPTRMLSTSSSNPQLPGWVYRNWSKYQPTKAELEENREKERIRKANYRMSQRDTSGTGSGQTEGHHPESGHPDPTRPDPTPIEEEAKASSSGPAKRGKRIPADFAVTPDMVAWARANCPTVDGQRETLKFINYYKAKTGKDATKLDWVATWRNWMLNAADRAPQGKPTTSDKMRDTLELGRRLKAVQNGAQDQLAIG
jgi:hypothetical protein